MVQKKYLLVIGAVVVVGLLMVASSSSGGGDNINSTGNGMTATVYKSATCGCCVTYVSYLEGLGYTVVVKNVEDSSIKEQYNIPFNMWSCHTTVLNNGYFIEGHVPVEAINKLLDEKPAIDGIALPDMPVGSPGMPGIKREVFEISAVTDGETSEFMNM